jgi:DNA-binding transcriptional ArsR family regulator
VDVFVALADPVRRAILRRLSLGPTRVVDLAADHPISRPAISRHLRLLAEAGLIHGQDRGRERHYLLAPSALAPVSNLLTELQTAQRLPVPESALDALETEVRRTVRAHRSTPADTGHPQSSATHPIRIHEPHQETA